MSSSSFHHFSWQALSKGRWLETNIDKLVLIIIFLSCLAFGGGDRPDILSLVFLDVISILCLTILVWRIDRLTLLESRGALLFWAAGFLLTLAQLIPLPPSVWGSLPGHRQFVPVLRILDNSTWRPLSIAPDLTEHSLLGLIAPLVVILAISSLGRGRTAFLVPLLLCMIAASAIFGLLQLSGGENSPFYTYSVTNRGSPTGLLANRNHAAFFLAFAMPLLALWPRLYPAKSVVSGLQWGIVAGAILFIIPLSLITGSRAGFLFALLGAAASLPLLSLPPRGRGRKRLFVNWRVWIPVGLLGLAIIAVSVGVLARAEALNRLFEDSLSQDLRERIFPTLVELVRTYFPTGAGFGTFDPVFRVAEPLTTLEPRYVNHAHNDLLELLIEAGLPGLILLVTFLCWWASRAWSLWRAPATDSVDATLGRAGTIISGILLVASLPDYPLRTPLLAVTFTAACMWMWRPRRSAETVPMSRVDLY